MKKNLFISIICILLLPNAIEAQEIKNALNINFQTNFYLTNDKYRDHDASFSAFNPGGEILYEAALNNKVSLLSGIDYNYCTFLSSIGLKSSFKDIVHEIFIPVLFNVKLNDRIYLSTGTYVGWSVKGKAFYKDISNAGNDWMDVTKHANYISDQKFALDLFLGSGFKQALKENQSIHFVPFIKYKLTDNWMEKYRSKVSFGIKINYAFEL